MAYHDVTRSVFLHTVDYALLTATERADPRGRPRTGVGVNNSLGPQSNTRARFSFDHMEGLSRMS